MAEYRFEGISASGAPVHGVIIADRTATAKRKVEALAASRRFRTERILPRRVWVYKVRRGFDKPITGEQKAFSREEVHAALERLGYTVIRVTPKRFNFKLSPPTTDIVTFVRVSADLLREKLPYNEVLELLAQDITHAGLREAVKEIKNDLKQGRDSEDAFMRQEKVLGKFTARMLGLASKSGNMSEIYDSAATFLERQAEFKKNLRSALIMPAFTLLLLFAACLFYVAWIFPQTAELFVRLGVELPPMTQGTLDLSHWLTSHWIVLAIINGVFVGVIAYLWNNPTFKETRDRWLWKIPVIGPLIHKQTIEIFCRVFYALYSGSGDSVDAIQLSAEACGNVHMQRRIKTIAIPMMLSHGKGIVESFEASGVFTKTALSRFKSGAETGSLRVTAQQIANYYEKETLYKMKNVVEFIQIVVAMIIMIVMTALTLISSETATISPNSF